MTAAPGTTTRPTADRVREALFSRLASRYRLDGASVLDLFAGTGALGIEALSRGAAELVSVESDRRAADVIEANLQRCDLKARVLRGEVAVILSRLAREGRVCDGVFVDPPYAGRDALDTLEALGVLGVLKPGGWVSVETDRETGLPDATGSLLLARRDDYGDTTLWLYESAALQSDG